MPSSSLELEEGQKTSVDDWAGSKRLTVNWMSDAANSIRLRPGIVTDSLLPPADIINAGLGVIGAYVWRNVVDGVFYVVFVLSDRTIWAKSLQSSILKKLSSLTAPSTLLDGAAQQVTFTEDGLRLIMAGGGRPQAWTGGAASQRLGITVGFLPPLTVTHIVNVGNYLVANDRTASAQNQLLWSLIGDGNHNLWNPLNFNTADADPDPVVAVGTNMREVVAFGSRTAQVFGLSSDPDLPFVSSTSLRIGCIAPYSIITRDGDYAWLDDQGRFITSDIRGYQWIGKDVFELVQGFPAVNDCFGFRLRMGFWDLLVWIFPTAGIGLAYDQERQDWRQWRGWNGVDDYAGIRIGCYATYQEGRMHIVGDTLFPNLWKLDASASFDLGPGQPIVAEKLTRPMDHGFDDLKGTERIRFFAKRGLTPNTAPEPAFLDLAVSDDGKPFRSQTRINLGVEGDYTSYRDCFPGGIYCRRQYRVRYSGGVDTSITRAVEFWESHGSDE